MMRLGYPLRDGLRDPLDEAAAQRVWRRIDARRRRGGSLVGRSLVVSFATGCAAAMVVIAALVASGWLAPPGPGPLRRTDGLDLAALVVDVSSRAPVAFDLTDGSRVALDPGTRLDTLANSGRAFVVAMGPGHATFEVKTGGPRRWSIECGVATVEVVGTGFAIDRRAGGARIDVGHGVVMVRGDRVPGGVRRLTDGESLTVAGPTDRAPPPKPVPEDRAPAPAAPSASAFPPSAQGAAPSWRDLANRGAFAGAYRVLGAAGIAEAAHVASIEDLMTLADVARLSGHPDDAIGPLRRVTTEHAGDARAGVAAFTLGRIEVGGRPSEGARDFALALSLGLPRGLQEDARFRLIEALSRAGDLEGARAAGAEYRKRFPKGPHASDVERLTPAPR